jgi:hypothetical protein
LGTNKEEANQCERKKITIEKLETKSTKEKKGA